MKKAVLLDKQNIVLLNTAEPNIDAGEVLLEVIYCGVSAFDTHWFNRGSSETKILGRGIVAKIIKYGDVYSPKVLPEGSLVVIGRYKPCGKCKNCVTGQTNKCLSPSNLFNNLGGYTSHLVLNETDLLYGDVLILDKNLDSYEKYIFIDEFAFAYKVMSELSPNSSVVLCGINSHTAMLSTLLTHNGYKCYIMDTEESKGKITKLLSINKTLNIYDNEQVDYFITSDSVYVEKYSHNFNKIILLNVSEDLMSISFKNINNLDFKIVSYYNCEHFDLAKTFIDNYDLDSYINLKFNLDDIDTAINLYAHNNSVKILVKT